MKSKFFAASAVFMLLAPVLCALELTKADFSGNRADSPSPPSVHASVSSGSVPSSGSIISKAGPQNGRPAGPVKADITFSKVFTVKNTVFKKNAVIMPVTVYKDRSYTDIKLLSKNIYIKIQACFVKGECVSRVKAATPVIKVENVKPLNSKTRVANADVSFDGELAVTLGVIKNVSGELWVAYPSDFEAKSAAFKSAISKAVKEAYAKASDKTSK